MTTSYFTKTELTKLPKLYETEDIEPEDKIARVKLFDPTSNWTWYVIEYDGQDTCWGYVIGHEDEFGYFSLKELGEVIGPFGLGIERDKWFMPCKVSSLT